MDISNFLNTLRDNPESIEFTDMIAVIESNYYYTPCFFTNGNVTNDAGQNEGSCKIMAFAMLNKLTTEQTLHCFGKHYREEVLNDPEGDSHQNIRQFIKNGFEGLKFEGEALRVKN